MVTNQIVLKKTVEQITEKELNEIYVEVVKEYYYSESTRFPNWEFAQRIIIKALELLSKEPERMYVVWNNDCSHVILKSYLTSDYWENRYIIPPGTVLTDLCRETWEAKRDNGELEDIR